MIGVILVIYTNFYINIVYVIGHILRDKKISSLGTLGKRGKSIFYRSILKKKNCSLRVTQ